MIRRDVESSYAGYRVVWPIVELTNVIRNKCVFYNKKFMTEFNPKRSTVLSPKRAVSKLPGFKVGRCNRLVSFIAYYR